MLAFTESGNSPPECLVVATKTCTKCVKTLPTTMEYFSRHSGGLCTICKECKNAATAVWRAANREKDRAISAAWRAAHPEKVKATTVAWRAANSERVTAMARARASAWYRANSKRAAAYGAAYRHANSERVSAAGKKWRIQNKDMVVAQHAAWVQAHPLYAVWNAMINRCSNPNNNRWGAYGAKGFKVCVRWSDRDHGYENFLSDIGPKPSPTHSLSRYLDIGNYEPGNVEWGTKAEQMAQKQGHIAMMRYRKFKLKTALVAV
jgi:hypothetical protein